MACSTGFDKEKYDIGDVKGICKRVEYSLVRSETLPFVGAGLSSQPWKLLESE